MIALIYMYELRLQNGNEYFLTSSSNSHKIDEINYLPNSGLNFIYGEFDESANNRVCIKGIFEENGILKCENLAGASVKISRLQAEALVPFITYFCTKYIAKDLEFEIWCEPEVVKYNQSVLQMFSKTCRANFGDERCKVDIQNYAHEVQIINQVNDQIIDRAIEINSNILKFNLSAYREGYFKGGLLKVTKEDGSIYEFKILSHYGNNIEIDFKFQFQILAHQSVTLIAGCDKNYRTCCYSYNNAVNFRGEPFIPESKILEN